jgi:3-polyprenyl-4-hydroxybenzoate decarboxylase
MALGIEVATKEHLRNVEGGLDLLDVRMVTSAGAMMLVIKLRPRVEGQAKTALMAALSGPSIANRVRADRDVIMIPNTRVFALDSVSPIVPGQSSYHRIGTKWMIDATMPVAGQEEDRKEFEPAMPKNINSVNLKDFLP